MNKTILVVVAHPDDEVLGCGGTIAKHVESGDMVHVIFMTNGVASRNVSNDEVKYREEASRGAAEILGVSSIQQFDFPDNKMDSIPLLDVVQSIEEAVERLQPKVLYTHHIGDLNIDHQITHKAVVTACRPQPNFCVREIYAFEVLSSTEWQTPGHLTFLPNTYIDISEQIKIKQQALRIYDKEMRQSPHSRSIGNSNSLGCFRGNAIGVEQAEAFVAVRVFG